MGRVFIFLIFLVPSFFFTCEAESSLLGADDTNAPDLNTWPLKLPPRLGIRISGYRKGSHLTPPYRVDYRDDRDTIPDTYVSGDEFQFSDDFVDHLEAGTSSVPSADNLVIPYPVNARDSSLQSGTDDSDVAASTSSTSSAHVLVIPNPLASVPNLLLGGKITDNMEATGASGSSSHSLVIPLSFLGGNVAFCRANSMEPISMQISQIPVSSPYLDPQISRNESTSSNHVIDHQNNTPFVTRNEPFELGQNNIGLTFQAILALMLFHFQGSSSFASTRSTSFHVVGFSMVIGFTFSLISVLLRNACPRLATIGGYFALLSTAFGFFMMFDMFLPHSLSWTLWPACVLVFLAFLFALARTR